MVKNKFHVKKKVKKKNKKPIKIKESFDPIFEQHTQKKKQVYKCMGMDGKVSECNENKGKNF